jgi:hypothetical protein
VTGYEPAVIGDGVAFTVTGVVLPALTIALAAQSHLGRQPAPRCRRRPTRGVVVRVRLNVNAVVAVPFSSGKSV